MDKQKRQDIIIKTCCVVAALILWMYIRSSENPVITSVIKYVPVQIINEDTLLDRDLTLISNQEFYVNLTVKATSSIIKDLDKNKDFKLVADLQGYALTEGENKVQVKVKEAPVGVTVVNSEGLLMKIGVDALADKVVSVSTDIIGEVMEGYYSEEPVVTPNSVKIFGPQRYLDKVVSAAAQVDITNASADIDESCKLKAVDSDGKEVIGVSVYPEYSQVQVNVKKGKVLNVNVVTKGTQNTNVSIGSMEAIPKNIEVVGATAVIDALQTIDTEPIDLSTINDNTTLNVNLIIPTGVHTVNNEKTVKVKFTVKKQVEKTFNIPITYANLGEGLSLEQDIKEMKLTLQGEQSEMDKLKVENFTVTAELKTLIEGTHEVQLQIAGVPSTIQIKTKQPDKIAIKISKKAEAGGAT
ncbi:MAG: CdaR family protein [Clostridium sp.]|uniref:CdaR family protein n=1 Tax=Clostridium sp. TaxID=1506 RepID=UPI003063BE00